MVFINNGKAFVQSTSLLESFRLKLLSYPGPITCCAPSGSGTTLRANHQSISQPCHLFEVAFVWESTREIIYLPPGCLQGGERRHPPTRTIGPNAPFLMLDSHWQPGKLTTQKVSYHGTEKTLGEDGELVQARGLIDGLIFKVHRLLNQSTLGSRVMKKKKRKVGGCRRECGAGKAEVTEGGLPESTGMRCVKL